MTCMQWTKVNYVHLLMKESQETSLWSLLLFIFFSQSPRVWCLLRLGPGLRSNRCLQRTSLLTLIDSPPWVANRKLKQPRRRPQRRLQKNKSFNDQNNSSARASRFLIHFFDVHCTTTTWNLRIWRFMEDVDIRRRIFLPLFEPE